MKFELERGSLGYIKKKKRRQILLILLMLVMAFVIFFAGLIMNKFDTHKANICAIPAMLMVLPAAKFLVIFIVLFPYRGVSEEKYRHVKESISENTILMTDMVITSSEKSMNLDFVLITDNQVLGVPGKKNQDVKYIEDYLKSGLKANNIEGFAVRIFDEYESFDKCIPKREFEKTNAQDECFRFIRTLVV